MSFKLIKEEIKKGVGATVCYKYTPDPTCFNYEGVEHAGTSCKNCACTSCRRVAILSASLGNFDGDALITDQNFPPRCKAMTPRLQAKIPKCFGWQLAPGREYYLWHDGNLELKDGGLKILMDAIKGYDIVVIKHPDRNTIWWEYRYNWRGLNNNAPSNYLTERYTGEFLDEQMNLIKADKNYVDDLLVLGGLFLYRNTEKVQEMLTEWWYHISRYLVMDQLSWAYVLKTSGVRFNTLEIDLDELVERKRHRLHA